MLDITEWLDQLSSAVNDALERSPEKAVNMLKIASEHSDTPVDSLLLLMQCTFLILLSFDKNADWEKEPARAGLLPAIFYLAEQWAEDQIDLSEEIAEAKRVPDNLMAEIYKIINNRGNSNGSTSERTDNVSGEENPTD
jgi:hypothetical protein